MYDCCDNIVTEEVDVPKEIAHVNCSWCMQLHKLVLEESEGAVGSTGAEKEPEVQQEGPYG